jgi:hypothetical protein
MSNENASLIHGNLPLVADDPRVSLYREQVEQFRADYLQLLHFAAEVCRVSPEELTLAHLVFYAGERVRK